MAGFLGIAKLFQVHTEERQVGYQYSSRSRWPISRDISCSSIGITNTHVYQVSAAGSIKWKEILRAIYFINTNTKFSIGKRAVENAITTMLCYYSKTFPGMAWLCTPKLYLLGIVSSYPFRYTAGLLIRQY